MRTLLVLFLVASVQHGGMGLSDPEAAAIYGLFMSGASLFGLPGGWLGDKVLGNQNAVVCGAILIIIGNSVLVRLEHLSLNKLWDKYPAFVQWYAELKDTKGYKEGIAKHFSRGYLDQLNTYVDMDKRKIEGLLQDISL